MSDIFRCNSKNEFMETVIKDAVKAEEVTQRTHKGQGKCLSGGVVTLHMLKDSNQIFWLYLRFAQNLARKYRKTTYTSESAMFQVHKLR